MPNSLWRTMHKPTAVSLAILGLWVLMGVDLSLTVIDRILGTYPLDLFIYTLVVYSLQGILPYMLNQGQSWPRYLLAVQVSVTAYLLASGHAWINPSLDELAAGILIPYELMLVYALFRTDSFAWFASQAKSRN